MKISEIIDLVGLKSTNQTIMQWFEHHGLGKPPKIMAYNPLGKAIVDKKSELSFLFDTHIINDQFYPPISPKKNGYQFECFLKYIILFDRKKKGNLDKPDGFWENYINPNSTYEDCLAYFNENHQNNQNNKYIVFNKMINNIIKLQVWMSADTKKIHTIQCSVKEDWELYSIHDFDHNNPHNTVKQAYLLLIKWLFDHRYLLLPKEAYAKNLDFNDANISHFISQYLHHHLWKGQLNLEKASDLVYFLHAISSTAGIELKHGETMNAYIKHLYLKEAGVWETFLEIKAHDDSATLENFEKTIRLNNTQCQNFMNTLTSLFAYYQQHAIAFGKSF